jgi:hypothetical protein
MPAINPIMRKVILQLNMAISPFFSGPKKSCRV